ncbi:GNAT family N-acetyltransferase [Frigoriflavimonas asaccharolytica]|uniref:GNAT superfamily N-acetyltransferase n=1 Tax=Frigoriflavimonas asaccharolytica TaxID=2735899 RepID=A0A8J8G7W9_9FLAO|nr:GNAT family N-acetyltransferase [Frigoriflavimonas asaccharolytica]NRS92906.1 GNAT superfamily N-acetyltransferase [Frigoriflavimonas asaccharolytica]
MKNEFFEIAKIEDAAKIWEILKDAIERRKIEGSDQWQNGYPNLEVVENDIEVGKGFVFKTDEEIISYCAISKNDEPAYDLIDGKWLQDGDYLVLHRLAVSEKFLGQGFAKKIIRAAENYAKENKIKSLRLDTKYDNLGMLKICEQLNYTYCGIVLMNHSERKAFEKILNN